MQELEKIEARLKAATPGPWHARPVSEIRSDVFAYGDYYSGRRSVATAADSEFGACPNADAEFIANAPADIARLLTALKAVMDLADYWQTLAPGDQHYAKRIQKAINEALEES